MLIAIKPYIQIQSSNLKNEQRQSATQCTHIQYTILWRYIAPAPDLPQHEEKYEFKVSNKLWNTI